ncbi:MAG: glycosyltransferase, partial [Planctomycetaceae bacterium]|nr:glycosyltransferase [Planctomycetaceae bacterium]
MHIEAGPLLRRTGARLGDWHERKLTVIGSLGTAECRPGHYLKFHSATGGSQHVEFDPSSLDVATREMLQSVCNAARTQGDVPSPGADARQTLEGLLLSGCSLRDERIAIAPVPTHSDPFADLASRSSRSQSRPPLRETRESGPRFSVLLPLIEDRGFVRDSLASWLGQERFAAEGYELLLLDDGSRNEMADQLRPLLRGGDRIICRPGVNRSELYGAGADEAHGEFVFLTESHCVPEPDCLFELDRFLQSHSYEGACCRSIPVCYNSLARADAHAFELGFREFLKEGDWRKVNVHGFALRKDVYDFVGGLRGRYDLFAEMVLAADLRDAGVRLGYAAGAAVQHHYRVTVSEMAEFVDGFVLGEMQYLHDYGSVQRIGFSFLEMCQASLEGVSSLEECLATEWQRLRRGWKRGDFTAVGACLSLLQQRLMAGHAGQVLAQLRVWQLAFRCWLTQRNLPRLSRNYEDLFHAAVARAARRCRDRLRLDEPRSGDLMLSVTDIPADWQFGFYPAETFEDRPFRWSRPAAGLDLPLQAG